MNFLIMTFLSALSFSAFSAPEIVPGKFNIDPAHTRVSFKIDHMVISEVEGRFNDVSGTITFGKKIEDTKADVTIPVASIDTGVKQRDDHLKSADFFDAGKHKNMTFKIKSVKADGDDEFDVVGDLTIKGITKQVNMEGEYKGVVKDSWGNQRVALTLEGKVNRKDFGINYNDKIDAGATIGDEVDIEIITQAIIPAKKK